MKTFNLILSRFFRIFLIFALAFIWFRFYEKNLLLAVVFSSVTTFALDIFLGFWTKKHEYKINLKNLEIKKAENFCNYFIFSSHTVTLNFFHKLLSNIFETTKKNNSISWQNNGKTYALYPYFIYDKFKIKDFITIYNKLSNPKPNKIIICSKEFDKEVYEFAKCFPNEIIFLNQYEVYEQLMKPQNIFPEDSFEFKAPKMHSLKTFMEYALNKKRAKGYIFASFILILSSFFVKVSIYYLIVSSILLILALFSFTNSTYNKPPEQLL